MSLLFIGIPSLYGGYSNDIDEDYFTKIIVRYAKIAVILEFVQNTFTYNIFSEFILIPFLSFIGLLQAFTSSKEKYLTVNKLLTKLIGYLGLVLIIFTVEAFINSYEAIDFVELMISFIMPLVLSTYYQPFIYILSVLEKYRMIFKLLKFKEPKDDPQIRRYHRMRILQERGLSHKRLCSFENRCMKKLYVSMSKAYFENILHQLDNMPT